MWAEMTGAEVLRACIGWIGVLALALIIVVDMDEFEPRLGFMLLPSSSLTKSGVEDLSSAAALKIVFGSTVVLS